VEDFRSGNVVVMNVQKDVLIINANVVTLDLERPRAQAVAVRNGKILDIGTPEKILRLAHDEAKIVDLHGRTVVPGLIDSHAHMLQFGQSLGQLNLRDVRSIEELQSRLRKYAEDNPENEWVLGGSWDQGKFSERRYPNRWDLDSAVSDRPVFLTRVCGHVCVVNSKALQLAGIDADKSQLKDKIDRDETTGEPAGILREEALGLIRRAMPKPSLEEIERSCFLACRKAVEAGLTGVNWLVSSSDEIRVLQKLSKEDRLPIRVCLGIPVSLLHHLTELGLATGFGNDMMKIGPTKVVLDGSLGGHTAALYEPYSDRQETTGMMLYTKRKLNNIILEAHEAHLQIAVHAIGDRAMDTALAAFEKALKSSPWEGHRHRIEHCSVLNPALIRRMKRLGIIASVQPHFVISDFWVTSRVGEERARWVYPFKSLLRTGLVVAGGSDCPVEPIDPLLGMWAAVARKDSHDENVTAEESLKMYTLNAAHAIFDEATRGSIKPGKLADLTILSDDPRLVSPDGIKSIAVEMVIVGGRIVYERP